MSSKRQCLTLLSVLLLLPLVTPQTYHGCIPEGPVDRINQRFIFSTSTNSMTSAACTSRCGRNTYALIGAAYNGDDFSCFCATTSSLIAYIKANPGSTSGVSCPLRCGNGEECGKSNDQIGALLGKQGSWSVYIDAATPSVPSPPPPPSPSAVNSLSPPPSPPSQPENPVNNNLAPADTSTPKQAESTPSSNPSDNPSDNPIEPSPASPSTTFSPRPFLPNAGAPAVAATMTRDTSLPATSPTQPPGPVNGISPFSNESPSQEPLPKGGLSNTGTVALSLVSVIIVVAVVTGLFVRYRRRETERKEEGGELGKLSANAKLRMLMIQPPEKSLGDVYTKENAVATTISMPLPATTSSLSTPSIISPASTLSLHKRQDPIKPPRITPTTSQEDHKPRRRAPSSIYMEAVAGNVTSPVETRPPVPHFSFAIPPAPTSNQEEPQTFTPLGRAPTVLMEEESKPPGRSKYAALVAARLNARPTRQSTVTSIGASTFIDHGSSLYGSSIMDGASVMSRPHSSDVMTGSVIMDGGMGVIEEEEGTFFDRRDNDDDDDSVAYSIRSVSTLDISRSSSVRY